MNVLAFPQAQEEKIPRPFNYEDGDAYCQVSFETIMAPPLGLPHEARYVIKEGLQCHGSIHAIYTPTGVYLARLYLDEPGWVTLESYNPSFQSGRCKSSEIDIIGAVEEYWPLGWGGPRFVLNPIDRREQAAARSLIAATN